MLSLYTIYRQWFPKQAKGYKQMNLSQQTYDSLMTVNFDDMNETAFHIIFDIWTTLTNDDLSPKNSDHDKLVSHLASELQI